MPESSLNLQDDTLETHSKNSEEDYLSDLLKSSEREYFPGEVAEIRGLAWAIQFSHQRSKSLTPLSLHDALVFHFQVSSFADELNPHEDYRPGQLRDRKRMVKTEPLIPPFPDDIPNLLDRLFEQFTHRSHSGSIEETYRNAAWFHFFFEKIHPFTDFNGRVGRLMVNVILEQADLRPVSDWQGEVQRRIDGGKQKARAESGYIEAIEKTERLRFNRWTNLGELSLPNYPKEGQSLLLSEIGEDYLLPLEIHLLSGGLKNEQLFLEELIKEKARRDEIEQQKQKIENIDKLLIENKRKLETIKTHAVNSLYEFELPRKVFPGKPHSHPLWKQCKPHSHPLWKQFISPEVS